jgi:hypothetical protein
MNYVNNSTISEEDSTLPRACPDCRRKRKLSKIKVRMVIDINTIGDEKYY